MTPRQILIKTKLSTALIILNSMKNIFITAALLDEKGNALGINSSRLEEIPGEGSREVVFTWREPFDPMPANIEVFIRTNLTE